MFSCNRFVVIPHGSEELPSVDVDFRSVRLTVAAHDHSGGHGLQHTTLDTLHDLLVVGNRGLPVAKLPHHLSVIGEEQPVLRETAQRADVTL